MKNNNSNGMNGMHNNNKGIPPNTIPFSRAHQIRIGDPHGKVSVGNPQGYSLSQRKQFNSFQRAEIDNIRNAAIMNSNIMGANLPIHDINNNDSNSNNNGNFETWNNVSMQPYSNNNQNTNNMNYNNTYMNMFEDETSNASSEINIKNLPSSSSLMSPVRQSNIQLTCYSCRGTSVQTRLRCSLLKCNYTLQVLQQVATND